MRVAAPAIALMLAASMAAAQQSVPFDGSWEEQGFLRLSSNDYAQEGNALGIRSDGTVSILYRRLPQTSGDVQGASWSWSVSRGVAATDLTRKGGDDRNIAIYFVFADPGTAAGLRGQPLRRLLSTSGVRVLTYVWGGSAGRGAILPNPYLEGRGTTIVLRGAGTGRHAERVDLASDLAAIFDMRDAELLGVAVSADSDDTDGEIDASVSDLVLR
ncbi:Protein of unknown function (DUF3047) [Palleronia aestuarii]|uniref:DUF3047 family protein n=1 Tax=Palleronia aestuarii TaxID=568105 RepID=A0A2W7PQQ6_9RHOB|nr:DUF3047 domain-containing protein [Palleronia aestuarii]PZX11769.1 Protein of unknown function (DUF3047) [Palleronia aestuarii]